ncbi:hypothetical protein HIM_06693 [Hirsutella minnesotensis 3608]|uniref:Uncharacterized protein n=1 Tax=Hirsutella minnesotensis 3608 TaxID=1043627 RepID=A0A0F7ZNM8_9HYPO|nr:hypothetical protein HIM_06693 [Hirsutella minnesotensis 3608]
MAMSPIRDDEHGQTPCPRIEWQSTTPDERIGEPSCPDSSTPDPFRPLDDIEPTSTGGILTPRAILLGSLCGALVNASNIYLGMKTGWMSSANILGVSLAPPHFPHRSCKAAVASTAWIWD